MTSLSRSKNRGLLLSSRSVSSSGIPQRSNHRRKARLRSLEPLKRILTLILILGSLVSSCVTVDEEGNPLDERKKNAYWNLQKLPEGPFWSDKEKDIPFLVVGLPSELPQRFVLEKVPSAEDQGRLAAGTAYAAGYLLMSMRERGADADYTCSPEFIYNSLNGGKNVGLEILEVME